MNIIVCIKRTPDTETRIRIADGGASIDPSGVKFIVSPYDEFAVENALRTREAAADGTVQVVTVGDGSSQETLRAALAMGADSGILLEGEPTQDGLATAKALAAEIGRHESDLVLLGVKAADDDQQQVGPMLGTLLGRPCVSAVSGFEVANGVATCRREVEGGTEVVEVPLPAVLTITKGEFEPRYASLKGIMAAKKKPIETKPAEGLESRLELISLELPAPRPEGRIVGEGAEAAPELARLLREEAKVM